MHQKPKTLGTLASTINPFISTKPPETHSEGERIANGKRNAEALNTTAHPEDLKGLKEAQRRLAMAPSSWFLQVSQGTVVSPIKHGRQSLVLEREIIALQRAITRGATIEERRDLVNQLIAARKT
jgi:hypothetical protein